LAHEFWKPAPQQDLRFPQGAVAEVLCLIAQIEQRLVFAAMTAAKLAARALHQFGFMVEVAVQQLLQLRDEKRKLDRLAADGFPQLLGDRQMVGIDLGIAEQGHPSGAWQQHRSCHGSLPPRREKKTGLAPSLIWIKAKAGRLGGRAA